MRLTALEQALMAAHGRLRSHPYSATWLWFDWTRDKAGKLTYRWKEWLNSKT